MKQRKDEKEMKIRKRLFIALAVISFMVIGFIVSISVKNQRQVEFTYQEALNLIADGNYTEAQSNLEIIRDMDYADTASFIQLCEAVNYFDNDELHKAVSCLRKVEFKTLTPEQIAEFEEYRNQVEADLEEYNRIAEIKAAVEAQERIRNGVPFVGMTEGNINNTSLGRPSSDIRHNYEYINGEQYLANLYDYKSGNRTIFTARCVRGVVTEVWDCRDAVPYVPSHRPSSGNHEEDHDEYNASDYSNEEDFYYDHYDDFYDYYDAEEYWNEHHD